MIESFYIRDLETDYLSSPCNRLQSMPSAHPRKDIRPIVLLNIKPRKQTDPGQDHKDILEGEIGVEHVAKTLSSQIALFTVPAVDHSSQRLRKVSFDIRTSICPGYLTHPPPRAIPPHS